jgi:hypothetical protein
MTVNYTDTALVHAYGGFTSPSEEDDALLEVLIAAASAMIDNYCGRVFAIADGATPVAHTFTEENGGWQDYNDTLWLDEDLCSTPTFAETPAPTVTYVPRTIPYNRIIRDDGSEWPDPTTVTGHWAYSMTPPTPVITACLRLVMWIYHQKETADSDRPVITNGMVIMPAVLPKDIEAMLAPYKRVKLP